MITLGVSIATRILSGIPLALTRINPRSHCTKKKRSIRAR